MPTPLAYNGPVRMAAGALDSREKGTESSLASLGPARWLLCPLTRSGFEAEPTVAVRATAGIGGSTTLQFIPYTEENRSPLKDGREAGPVTHPAVSTAPRRCLHLLANRLIRYDGE